MAEAREVPAGSFLSRFTRGDRRPSEFRKWLVANWSTIFILALLFVVALFVRTYFGYEIAMDGYLVSGGSDSYYWQRIIDYGVDTGKQLYWDPLINYPDGIRNPRPPFYSMSIVVSAIFGQGMFDSVDDAVGFSLLWSTSFWGALTVIPTYLVGKEAFGRRAGLVAAFFLAIMPSHVQRSVFSNADHDSFILFFVVLTFYFMLRAIKTQEHKKWIENWRSWASIKAGLQSYFRESRTPVLYSLMAGVAYGCVIMAWVGFGYVTVLILAYYVVQILLNKFKGFDSTSVTMIVAITMAFGYLLSFPVYYEQNLISVRFDVPVYLFLVAIVFGLLFVISRDYPWTLALPAIFLVVGVGVLVINAVDPSLAQAILSGQGYFVKSKLYSTIAEARAPRFSELAMSFGMITFFLSLIGLVWAIIKLPKRATAEYILIVVWLGAAIFMAISAGRFMFNAAPAFALAAAWVVVIIVDKLDFNSVRKSLMGASGSYFQVFKKSVKVRHIVGALFIGFMIVLPNVWYGTDAGIPSETKSLLDKQIYESMPRFMRPSDYDRINGSNWYLGAFGYSIPLERYYFPAAWKWFAEYDSHIAAVAERPAYVSWWDYGFEAVQAGQHPTVADNFQNGYQIAGNIMMAQSEAEVIALFSYRLLDAAMNRPELKAAVGELFDRYGVDAERMQQIRFGPAQPLIDEVLGDPLVYGPMDSDLSEANARIVTARVELVKLGQESLVRFYGDLCKLTGWNIRYFSVDSRLFPISGTNTGIFYAPAKLSDRRIIRDSTPIDFYDVKAVDQFGRQIDFEDITADTVITDYQIVYKAMFYNSTFYRAMCGPSGYALGKSNDGIPGLSGTLASESIMPGWNMANFRMIYRTAYYNPYPVAEIPFHRDAWTAISFEEAQALKTKIQRGEVQGYVDDSGSSYYNAGVVFLKYYMGAYVNGTVTTVKGHPVANVRATVQDEYGIPHMTVQTDAQGRYSLLAPFGNVTVVLSMGAVTTSSLVGANVIDRLKFNVTDDQAMRLPYDLDGNGIYDYIITKDYQMRETQVTADLFWDMDGDGNYTTGKDEFIADSTIYAKDRVTGTTIAIPAPDGTFDSTLPPGSYDLWTFVYGVNTTVKSNLTIGAGQKSTQAFAIRPGAVAGFLTMLDGRPASDVEIVMTETKSGHSTSTVTDDEGMYRFEKLLSGQYRVTVNEPGYTISASSFSLNPGSELTKNYTMFPEASVRARVLRNGVGVPYAAYSLIDVFSPSTVISGMADGFGRLDVKVPKGLWTLYAVYSSGTGTYAGASTVDVRTASSISTTVSISEATEVSGGVRNSKGIPLNSGHVAFESSDGVRIPTRVDSVGVYRISLPHGNYRLTTFSTTNKCLFSGTVTVSGTTMTHQIQMVDGVLVEGAIWLEKDSVAIRSPEELGRYAKIRLTDQGGAQFLTSAGDDGTFSLVYPKGGEATFSVGEAGYSRWSVTNSFTLDVEDVGVVAIPDNVAVEGRVTYEGLGLRGVSITFTPKASGLDIVTVATSSGGYYTAALAPGAYRVTVSQDTSPMGGERYIYEANVTFSPTGTVAQCSFQPDKKVEMYGYLFGAASGMELRLSGPEKRLLRPAFINYSVYLLPGQYSVYAKGYVGNLTYANITSVDLSYDARAHDFRLYPASELYGSLSISGRPVTKDVTIRAVSAFGEIMETESARSSYSIELPQGAYDVSFRFEDTLTSSGRTLYVEYAAESVVTVGTTRMRMDKVLEMRLDNTTFSGTVYGIGGNQARATVVITPTTVFGMGVSFDTDVNGAFNVSIQPGDYTVHVVRMQDKSAFMSTLRINRNTPVIDHSVNLVPAYFLSGRTLAGEDAVSVEVSIASGNAKIPVLSDASGDFRALVPDGRYILSSSTKRVENGLTVTYTGSLDVNVEGTDKYVSLKLLRDTRRSVSVKWDKNLTQTVPPGVPVKYSFTVTNTGNIADTWTVASSAANFNITFTPDTFELGLGSSSRTTIVAEITAQDDVPAGQSTISAVVRSKTQSSARGTVNMYLNVSAVHNVRIASLNTSSPAQGRSVSVSFTVNNTGNVESTYMLNISNYDSLLTLGWSASLIDPDTGEIVTQVKIPAFAGEKLMVKFTATRGAPDTAATALILATSADDPSASFYGSVQVRLPDLLIGPGDVDAERSDVSYEFDVSRSIMNISLLVALVALVIMFFVLRRKKGFGRGGAQK